MSSPRVLESCLLGQRQAEEEEGSPGFPDVSAGFSPFIICWPLVALLPMLEHLGTSQSSWEAALLLDLTPLTMPRVETCPVTD